MLFRSTLDSYADALVAELEAVARLAPGVVLEGVQWGGGTPSQLGAERLRQVGERIRSLFDRRCDAEMSLEIDPRQCDAGIAEAVAAIGVSRVSLGVQDFDPAVQVAINRRQSFEDTHAAIARLRLETTAAALLAACCWQLAACCCLLLAGRRNGHRRCLPV